MRNRRSAFEHAIIARKRQSLEATATGQLAIPQHGMIAARVALS
jgi:hypothetical protein